MTDTNPLPLNRRSQEIDVQTIRALTVGSKRRQKDWLALHAKGNAPYGRNIRTWICGGQQISTKCALFDPANYTGEKVDDPFEEWEYFVDVAQLWQLQNAAIAGKRRGWPGVEVFEIGQHFENWKYQKVAKKDGGKVYICPNRDGSVSIYDGFLPNAEARKVEKAKDREENPAEGNTERKADRPELTSWAGGLHERACQAAVRAALVSDPGVAFRLLIAQAIGKSSAVMGIRSARTARTLPTAFRP